MRLGYLKERKIFRDLLTVSEGDDYIKINRQVYGIWKEWLSQTEKGDLLLDGWGSPFYFMLTTYSIVAELPLSGTVLRDLMLLTLV